MLSALKAFLDDTRYIDLRFYLLTYLLGIGRRWDSEELMTLTVVNNQVFITALCHDVTLCQSETLQMYSHSNAFDYKQLIQSVIKQSKANRCSVQSQHLPVIILSNTCRGFPFLIEVLTRYSMYQCWLIALCLSPSNIIWCRCKTEKTTMCRTRRQLITSSRPRDADDPAAVRRS